MIARIIRQRDWTQGFNSFDLKDIFLMTAVAYILFRLENSRCLRKFEVHCIIFVIVYICMMMLALRIKLL